MPLPSYATLRKERDELNKMVIVLSEDPNYKITTRQAIPFEMRRLERGSVQYVVFLDIDDCHGLNARLGYEEVNKRIRRAIHVRCADVLLRARWFSGDEIIVLLRGDPEGFCARLRSALHTEGIRATMAYAVYTGKLEQDVATAAALVAARKTGHLV